MDPISILAGAVVLLVGIGIGRISRRKDRASTGSPAAVCEGCEHGLSFHDEKNRCRSKVARNRYDSIGGHTGKEYVDCTCRQYIGPIPAERMIANFPLPSSLHHDPTSGT
jgi:hypothetical protein